MASLAQINVKFSADLKGFSSEMQNALRTVDKAGKQFSSIGRSLSTYVTLPILAAGAASIKFASDYNESLNKVDVAFGSSSAAVKEFAKDTLQGFGIAEGTALDMAANFGDMATSMNLPVEKAAAMSKSLVGLAGDLSSFKNIGIEQATTALNGVFTGETESLKMLGIVMTEANLKTFALSKGIQTQIKDMTQADKVALRYAYVMENTKNAQGDFARTSDGSANQMRIFQESMKQVGQQIGSVILPAFTEMLSAVNKGIEGFSNLSDGTKTMIVTIAGIAAAAGPAMSALGGILSFVPNMITKFSELKSTVMSLYGVMAANPFTAIAIALGAITSVLLISGSRFTSLTNATEEFSKVNNKASESIAKEKAELEKNLVIAKNKHLSTEVRTQAIKNLNAISPEFLGNISLESVYTKETTAAVEKYNEALLKKAKIQAANEKLIEVEKQLLDLQLGQGDAVRPSIWQNLGNALTSMGNSAAFASSSMETVVGNLGEEQSELKKLQAMLTSFIGKNTEVATSNDTVAESIAGITKAAKFKEGTVAFYEDQLSGLQKLQKEIPTTNGAWRTYEDQIDAIQKKIDALTNTDFVIKKPKLPTGPEGDDLSGLQKELRPNLGFLQQQVSDLEAARTQWSTTSDEYQAFSEKINAVKVQIAAIDGSAVSESLTDIKTKTQEWVEEFGELLGEGMSAAFEGFSSRFVDSLGLASDGFQGFISELLKTVTKLISMMLAQSIAQSIAGATASGAATGPAAIFTTPAFIATAISGVIGAFATIPKFETGGIFGGSSYYGDKILARVNSGEMVMNQKQQRKLFGMINPAAGAGDMAVQLVGDFKLRGADVELMLKRTQGTNSRIK